MIAANEENNSGTAIVSICFTYDQSTNAQSLLEQTESEIEGNFFTTCRQRL